jgi:hypothetical protein
MNTKVGGNIPGIVISPFYLLTPDDNP